MILKFKTKSISETFYEVYINKNRTKRSVEDSIEELAKELPSNKNDDNDKETGNKKKGLRHYVPGRPHLSWTVQKIQHFPKWGRPSRPVWRWVRRPEWHRG